MKTRTCIVLVFLIVVVVVETNSHKCHFSCRHKKQHGFNCPPLNSDYCEIVPCGCCKRTCALNLNEQCSSKTPRCAKGLMCVNGNGEALRVVPRHMKHYIGVCQNVVLSPLVVENTDVQERRVRI